MIRIVVIFPYLFAFSSLLPLLTIVILSLSRYENYKIVNDFGLQTISSVWSNSTVLLAVKETAFLSLFATVIALLLGIAVAFFYYSSWSNSQRLTIVIACAAIWFVNLIIKVFGLRILFSDNSGLNYIFSPILFFVPKDFRLFSISSFVISLVFIYLPPALMALLIGVNTISRDAVNAARNLGADILFIGRKIILPQIYPFVMLFIIIFFSYSFSDFLAANILGGGRAYVFSLRLMDSLKMTNLPEACAMGLLFVLIQGVILFILYRLLIRFSTKVLPA